MNEEDQGASASRPGCEPTASAAQEGVFAESHPSRTVRGLERLTRCGEDFIWRPALAAQQVIAALSARVAELEGELARRDRNETRNCLNWGPCSHHDGRMTRGERVSRDHLTPSRGG